MKIMSASFDWAKDFAKESFETIARARRHHTDIPTEEMRHSTGEALFGSAYETIANQLTKRLTDRRLEKGIGGDASMFARWGITPSSIKKTEKKEGRVLDPLDFAERFASAREKIEDRLDKAREKGQTKQVDRANNDLEKMYKDTTRGFGAKFSDVVFGQSSQHIRDLKDMFKEVGDTLGATTNIKDRAKLISDFDLNYQRFGAIWSNFRAQVAEKALPAINAVMADMGKKLQAIAPQLAEMMGTVATKGWETLQKALGATSVDELKTRLSEFGETLKGLDTDKLATGLQSFMQTLVELPGAIANAAAAIRDFLSVFGWAKSSSDQKKEEAARAQAQDKTLPADKWPTYGPKPGMVPPMAPDFQKLFGGVQYNANFGKTAPFAPDAKPLDPTALQGSLMAGGQSAAAAITESGSKLGSNAGSSFMSSVDGASLGAAIGNAAAAILRGITINVNTSGIPGASGGASKGPDVPAGATN
jgi:hypothetical protein